MESVIPKRWFSRFKPSLIYIYDGGIRLKDSDLDSIIKSRTKILCRTRNAWAAQVEANQHFKGLSTETSYIYDHPKIDNLISEAQAIGCKLAEEWKPLIPPLMQSEYKKLKNSIALVLGEYFITTLHARCSILEKIREANFEAVLILGTDEEALQSLSNLLTRDRIKNEVISPNSVLRSRENRILKRLNSFVYSPFRKLQKSFKKDAYSSINPLPIFKSNSESKEDILKSLAAGVERNSNLALVSDNPDYLKSMAEIARAAESPLSIFVYGTNFAESKRRIVLDYFSERKDHVAIFFIDSLRLLPIRDKAFLEMEQSLAIWKEQAKEKKNTDVFFYEVVSGSLFLAARMFISMLCAYNTFKQFWLKINPRTLLVSPQRNWLARTLADSAKSFNVTTFDLSVGALRRSRIQWKSSCDHVFVACDHDKKIQVDYFKISEKNVHIIGIPKLDYELRMVRKEIFLGPKEDGIFLALQHGNLERNLHLIAATVEAAEFARLKVVVGIHPRESDSDRERISCVCSSLGEKVIITTERGIIAASKQRYCVTFFSALAYEAFALGARVIAFNIRGEPWPVRLSKIGIAIEAYSVKELIEVLSKNQEKEILIQECLTDQQSASRLNSLVDKFGPIK